MGKSSDELRDEIDSTRDDAGAKIDHLQHQVQGQIDETRQQVTDTAQQVTNTAHQVREEAQGMVDDTIDTVSQTVQDFDFAGQVQKRPLVSMGAALLGGFVLGSILGGDDDRRQGGDRLYDTGSRQQGYAGSQGSSGHGLANNLRSAAQKSGLEDTLSNAGAALVGSLTEQLKDTIDRSFPGFSDKLEDAQNKPGSFQEKARDAQQDAQKN